jgi:L-fuculose-phosphate aldolase
MKQAITEICHKLYERGYLVATSGNVSVRTDDGILITPTATRKDRITIDSIVRCDRNGSPLASEPRPSSEIEMHKAVYEIRPDICAAIHAHPAHCVACSLMGISLAEILIPESVIYTGPAPTVPYAMPGSKEQADAVRPFLTDHNAMLLERHGILVLGRDLAETLSRLEQLEYVAHITYLARTRGTIASLPSHEIEKIMRCAHERGYVLPPSVERLAR